MTVDCDAVNITRQQHRSCLHRPRAHPASYVLSFACGIANARTLQSAVKALTSPSLTSGEKYRASGPRSGMREQLHVCVSRLRIHQDPPACCFAPSCPERTFS
eukprot:6175221-Pleurochrysis_carterae.AAC.2